MKPSKKNEECKPQYAVIFTSKLNPQHEGYHQAAALMVEKVKEIDGFMGEESARDDLGITISYWRDKESIDRWRDNIDHKKAKERGIKDWYSSYSIRICKIEHEDHFNG